MSFVNEIDDVVYILTVLSFFIFIGCYYLFRTLSLSFYYTHYCKILLYYIIYYIVNTQLSSCKLFTNKLSIYLSVQQNRVLSHTEFDFNQIPRITELFIMSSIKKTHSAPKITIYLPKK